jgi:hypothetical protein
MEKEAVDASGARALKPGRGLQIGVQHQGLLLRSGLQKKPSDGQQRELSAAIIGRRREVAAAQLANGGVQGGGEPVVALVAAPLRPPRMVRRSLVVLVVVPLLPLLLAFGSPIRRGP